MDCKWEGIGTLICEAGIPEETYRAAVGLALDMAADPEWQRAVGVVAAALERVSFLDAADVSMLLAA